MLFVSLLKGDERKAVIRYIDITERKKSKKPC